MNKSLQSANDSLPRVRCGDEWDGHGAAQAGSSLMPLEMPVLAAANRLCRGIRSGACAYRIGAAMSGLLQLDLADVH